jgi:YHS domain-containing protein
MKRALLVLSVVLAAAACVDRATVPSLEMRTLENTEPRLMTREPVPSTDTVLTPPAAPQRAEGSAGASPQPPELPPDARIPLPFEPPIAMDPVDGSKVSIRAGTPVTDYENKIYYFSSAGNKQRFLANPDEFLTGRFTRY